MGNEGRKQENNQVRKGRTKERNATQNQNQKKRRKKEKARHTVRVTTVRFRFPISNHPSPSASSCDTTDSDSVLALVAALVVPVTDPSYALFLVFAGVDGGGAETTASIAKSSSSKVLR